ncbi:hypothetical protein L3X38_001835 [Prunus dulcis]|uniref:Reverse transcriptase domain-containing protein n=1 Tax=Prunus dulcis TaxID=3755 RepID=A0AAD4WSU7_PRUDU|nr:hypothetical protein L3X38_001835 [Prunus dulcis]
MIAHEAFHSLKIRRKTKNFEIGLKVDMNKTYDRIEWDFLRAILEKMGFATAWVQMVMSCITSVELEVLINGKTSNSFKPSRGLRQGDPIFPYLFIIITDVLSTMINCVARAQNCRVIERILQCYCQASGQLVNFEKSNMFFSLNTPMPLRTQLQAILGVNTMMDPGKYLGLPPMWGR